ncbi:unnamed protein product [Urochloa humidicola]
MADLHVAGTNLGCGMPPRASHPMFHLRSPAAKTMGMEMLLGQKGYKMEVATLLHVSKVLSDQWIILMEICLCDTSNLKRYTD